MYRYSSIRVVTLDTGIQTSVLSLSGLLAASRVTVNRSFSSISVDGTSTLHGRSQGILQKTVVLKNPLGFYCHIYIGKCCWRIATTRYENGLTHSIILKMVILSQQQCVVLITMKFTQLMLLKNHPLHALGHFDSINHISGDGGIFDQPSIR